MGLPPINLWELKEAHHRLRAEGRRAVDEKTIFAAIREQRRIVEQATASKRRRCDAPPKTKPVLDAKLEEAKDIKLSDVSPFEVEELS